MKLAQHSCHDLVRIFRATFFESHHTELQAGAAEPLYRPAEGDSSAQVYFREDYFSSALHEVAHWCIAGTARRRLVDYGYWYIADGRDEAQQQKFFAAEVKPQALEWMFSVACNYPFTVSVDNANVSSAADWQYWEALEQDKQQFRHECRAQIRRWLDESLPQRAERFLHNLMAKYRPGHRLTVADFD